MAIEINEDALYYFTALVGDKYHTVFVGWLRKDLIKAFEAIQPGSSYAHIRLSIGENTFISNVGAPLYLLDYEDDNIFEFAGDNNELDLFPSGNIPENLDMESIIDFPSYFELGVAPLLKFKLFNQFYANRDGVWIPLEV